MKIEVIDGSVERRLVIAMITNPTVLGHLASKWRSGLFASKQANLVGKICTGYYEKYRKCPGPDIQTEFELWAETATNGDHVKLVDQYLSSLSNEFTDDDPQNDAYLIDLAGKHFNAVAARKLAERITAHLDSGDMEKALTSIHNFSRVEVGTGKSMPVYHDHEAIRQLLAGDQQESLIQYPKPMDEFFGRSLYRGAFVNFLAAEKVGKSFFLMDLAFRAMSQRRRVAFFGLGDMTENEMLSRFLARAMRRPVRADKIRVPKAIARPKKAGDPVRVEWDEQEFLEPATEEEALAACEEVIHARTFSKCPYLHMYFYPNSSCTVQMISQEVEHLQREDWAPDCVVLDYADIIAPPPGVQEPRERINENWKAMRRLSQEHRVLLVTATQAPARSYGKTKLGRNDYDNDKRKRAHVTGEIGITQSEEDQESQVYRLNWTVRREDRSQVRQLFTAGCLGIASPAMIAAL